MPLKCTVVPERTRARRFTERDAARITCRVIAEGGSEREIELAMLEICPDTPRPKRADAAALAAAAQALEDSNITLELTLAFFALLTGLLTLLRFLGRTPATLPLRLAAAPALTQVAGVVGAVTVRIAANNGAIAIVRQAAANAARFSLRAAA